MTVIDQPATEKATAVTVVVPAFNEAGRLGDLCRSVVSWRPDQASRVILVDDGSADTTVAEFRSGTARAHVDVRVVSMSVNKGKGAAVRAGFAAAVDAGARWVVFTDADLAIPFDDVLSLVAAGEADPGVDVVIGSRRLPGSLSDRRPLRRAAAWGYRAVVRGLRLTDATDPQCGAKAFRAAAAADILGRVEATGFAFDVEVLHLARRLGYTVVEHPVAYRDVPESTVRVVVDAGGMLAELLRIRWRHRDRRLATQRSARPSTSCRG